VRQNLFWAFAYNGIGILLAAAGWLNPIWAAVAMVGSSLFVISNSLRLSKLEDGERPIEEGAEKGVSVPFVSPYPISPEPGSASSAS